MNEYNLTPEVIEAQRKVAIKAEEDAELVAATVMAFAAGLAVGEARAKNENK